MTETKMEYIGVNFKDKFEKFFDLWMPRIVSQFNNYHIKLVKVKGEFTWHNHTDTDEFFLVLDGTLDIHFRDGKVKLDPGEMFVVPKGMEHKPSAEKECHILLIELAGTINTGNIVNAMTVQENIWI
jgi:mannose-6-phosphate isomerase-like protein (cupin superfamily)